MSAIRCTKKLFNTCCFVRRNVAHSTDERKSSADAKVIFRYEYRSFVKISKQKKTGLKYLVFAVKVIFVCTCLTIRLTESFKMLSLGWYAPSFCNSWTVRLWQDFSDVHGGKRIESVLQPIKHHHSVYWNHSGFVAGSSVASQCLSTNLRHLWPWFYQIESGSYIQRLCFPKP